MEAEDQMQARGLGPERVLVGIGGVLLIVSVFLPWSGLDGFETTGWELTSGLGVIAVITGLVAVAAAATGGRVGLFRPDVSMSGAADILSLATTLAIAWLVLFDFPAEASREPGIHLGLAASIVIAAACGDYRVMKGAPLFPRI